MTTEPPIYLVSACASGEEFVAAFRRYADRNGVLFVPIAEPLAKGKKTRFAITLKDGGVMIDGIAEIVSSARTPSVVHGRVGMTLKFVQPDEPSKQMLGDLEKARTALKPLPPSVPPRPADVPPQPRPTPPAPLGRIDANNALAECVAIGELEAADMAGAVPPKLGSPKFVVPTIPGAVPRPKSGTTPPALPPPRSTAPTPAAASRATVASPAVLPPRAPAPTPAVSTPAVPTPAVPGAKPSLPTSLGVKPFERPPELTPAASPVTTTSEPTPAAPAAPVVAETPAPKRDRRTQIGVAITPSGVLILPAGGVPSDEPTTTSSPLIAVEEPTPSGDWTMTPGADGPTLLPRDPQPVEPPIDPPTGDWSIAIDPTRPDGWTEPSKIPKPDAGPPVSAVSSARPLDSDAQLPKATAPPDEPKVQIDPTLIEPPLASLPFEPERPSRFTIPTGGMQSLSPGTLHAPDHVPSPAPLQPIAMPAPEAPAMAGSGPVPATGSVPGSGPVPGVPTQPPMLAAYVAPVVAPPVVAPPVVPVVAPPVVPLTYPSSRMLTDAGTGFFRETGDQPRYPSEALHALHDEGPGRKRRMILIIASAAALLAIGIVMVILFGVDSDKRTPAEPTTQALRAPDDAAVAAKVAPPNVAAPDAAPGSAAIAVPNQPPPEVAPSADAGAVAVAVDAGIVEAPADAAVAATAPAPATDCTVRVVSVPAGAEISIEKEVKGTAPLDLLLPCGVETKIAVKKARYMGMSRSLTPKPEQKPIKLKLERLQFSVKVTSTPPGAIIFVGSRAAGTTPSVIKLPGFEASTLKLAKDGFAADTQRVTPKQNNTSVHATLKKLPRATPPPRPGTPRPGTPARPVAPPRRR